MDCQSEELKVLAQVKRKLHSEEDTNHSTRTTGSSSLLSVFAQSALKQTPTERVERGGESRSREEATSSGKRQRLSSRGLQRRLEAVRFPGYSEGEEEEGEGCDAAIDVFSESGSELDSVDDIQVEEGEDVKEEEEGEGEGQDVEEEEGEEKEEGQDVKEEEEGQDVKEEEEVRERGTGPPLARNKRSGSRRREQRTITRSRMIDASADAENIREFESCSSESSDSSLPPAPSSPPHTSTPSHSPHHHHSMTIRDFCNLACDAAVSTTPIPEYTSIVTPPSSPELTPAGQSSSKPSAGAWMRRIALESAEEISGAGRALDDTLQQKQSLNDTSMTVVRGLGDSVERRGRGRGRRIVPGGLAEAAERVAQRENSEITFWEHRSRNIRDSEIVTDLSVCLTVDVCTVISSHSLKVTRCRIPQQQQQQQQQLDDCKNGAVDMKMCEGNGLGSAASVRHVELRSMGGVLGRHDIVSCETGGVEESVGVTRCDGGDVVKGGEWGEGEVVTVLFSTRAAKFLDLQIGQRVRIHPPWQCLTTPSFQHKVVLCTHFCQQLTGTAVSTPQDNLPTLPSLPSSHGRRGVEGVRELHSPHKSPTSHTSMLTKSPARPGTAPTRLFPRTDVPHMPRDHASTSHNITELQEQQQQHRSSDNSPTHNGVCSSLLTAIEGACQGELSLRCRVLRVYRRAMHTSATLTSGSDGGTERCLWTKRAPQPSQKTRWCLLVCDASGVFCELQVSDFYRKTWSEVVRSGEGGVYAFKGIRVARRTNPARNPEVFSLIRCLCGQLTPSTACQHQVESPSSGGETPTAISIPVPSYCYVLVSGPGSVPIPCQGEDVVMFPALSNNASSTVSRSSDHDYSDVTRCNVYARVVYYQPELPLTVLESSPTHNERVRLLMPHYGHYLFLVASPHSTLSHSSPPPTLQCHHPHSFVTPSHSPPSPTAQCHHGSSSPQPIRVYVKPHFPREDVEHILSSPGEKLMIRDMEIGTVGGCTQYSIDACSLIHPLTSSTVTNPHVVYPQYKFSTEDECVLHNLPPPTLPPISPHCERSTLVTVSGEIVGVDQESAFSWPECNICGNGKLTTTPSTTGKEVLYCDECQTAVDSPSTHLQLAVYIQPHCTTSIICAQLLQSTIKKLLPVSPESLDEGFDISHVLKKSLHLDACYIHDISESKYAGDRVLRVEEICIGPPQYQR